LQPWHISTEAHNTDRDGHAIDGDAVLVHAMVLEDGHSPRFANPDVPELAHDQRYVPCRVSLHITFLYAVHWLYGHGAFTSALRRCAINGKQQNVGRSDHKDRQVHIGSHVFE
jgi:hypothetical protein